MWFVREEVSVVHNRVVLFESSRICLCTYQKLPLASSFFTNFIILCCSSGTSQSISAAAPSSLSFWVTNFFRSISMFEYWSFKLWVDVLYLLRINQFSSPRSSKWKSGSLAGCQNSQKHDLSLSQADLSGFPVIRDWPLASRVHSLSDCSAGPHDIVHSVFLFLCEDSFPDWLFTTGLFCTSYCSWFIFEAGDWERLCCLVLLLLGNGWVNSFHCTV